jgi:hypothetical protein
MCLFFKKETQKLCGKGNFLDTSTVIAILSFLIATLSALYARWSAKEAIKANDIGRMNALLSFRKHYLELMAKQQKMGEILKDVPSGIQAVMDEYAELDKKLREVSIELDKYHNIVVKNEI